MDEGFAVFVEAFPDAVQARLEARERFLRNLPPTVNDNPLEFVIEQANRWVPGQTIKVAFDGGSAQLYQQIAGVADEWTRYGNITLSFTDDNGDFRSWTESDQEYAGDIRISFAYPGYWSMVGTDSVDPFISPTNEPSMNYGGFAHALPAGWEGTVLHEFGHALGFHHEHQSPVGGCDLDFRWDDDPGYERTTNAQGSFITDSQGRRPGIYTVLGGPPNNWPAAKVDHNLRQLRDSHAYLIGPFDRTSIMKYSFPEWMFHSGTSSHCFSDRNLTLSEQDRAGIAAAYPGATTAAPDVESRSALEGVQGAVGTEEFHHVSQLEGLAQ